MRQVLIDHSRSKKSASRIYPELIPELLLTADHTDRESALAVKMVFEKLRTMDREVAETVWARCVEGRTIHEVTESQNREAWRVRADYDFGLQWMANRLKRVV